MKGMIFFCCAMLTLYFTPAMAAETTSSAKISQSVDLKKVFDSSPIIYSVLAALSMSSMVIWLYTLSTFRTRHVMPQSQINQIKELLQKTEFHKAELLTRRQKTFFGSIIETALSNRMLGKEAMLNAMKAEGKRASSPLWQRLSLLNDVIVIAPMFGLLGTVIGMFYAFYDINRSVESVTALYDGIGISVGTTVGGLVVSIIAMMFLTTLKYRMVRTLNHVEAEAFRLSTLIYAKGE